MCNVVGCLSFERRGSATDVAAADRASLGDVCHSRGGEALRMLLLQTEHRCGMSVIREEGKRYGCCCCRQSNVVGCLSFERRGSATDVAAADRASLWDVCHSRGGEALRMLLLQTEHRCGMSVIREEGKRYGCCCCRQSIVVGCLSFERRGSATDVAAADRATLGDVCHSRGGEALRMLLLQTEHRWGMSVIREEGKRYGCCCCRQSIVVGCLSFERRGSATDVAAADRASLWDVCHSRGGDALRILLLQTEQRCGMSVIREEGKRYGCCCCRQSIVVGCLSFERRGSATDVAAADRASLWDVCHSRGGEALRMLLLQTEQRCGMSVIREEGKRYGCCCCRQSIVVGCLSFERRGSATDVAAADRASLFVNGCRLKRWLGVYIPAKTTHKYLRTHLLN